MTLIELLEHLACPYCGSKFRVALRLDRAPGDLCNGVLRCGCYRYPIVEGIAVLKHQSDSAEPPEKAVACLLAGDVEGALRHLFFATSPIVSRRTFSDRAWRLQRRLPGQSSVNARIPSSVTGLRRAIYQHRPTPYADYLYHRFANASFLASIPLLLLVKEQLASYLESIPDRRDGERTGGGPYMLDVNCGIGHASFLLASLFPEIRMLATDHDFVNLLLAKRFLIPDVCCLCLNAEVPLPFRSQFFEAALCLDGLHYIHAKQAAVREIRRVVTSAGLLLFPHMHNARVSNTAAGLPLAPDDYRRCMGFASFRLLPESSVFRGFMERGSLDLTTSASDAELDEAHALSLIACDGRETLWRNHTGLSDLLSRHASTLDINPIYVRRPDGRDLRLVMQWPSASLEEECQSVKEFMPAEVRMQPSLLTHLKNGKVTSEENEEIRRLMRSCVLVHLPRGYA